MLLTSGLVISAIITSHNENPKIIENAIKSAIAASFSEIILIDNNSLEESRKLYKEICDKYEVRFIENEVGKGVSSSRNIGIQESKGKYISFLDGDDEFDIKQKDVISKALLLNADILVFPIKVSCKKETTIIYTKNESGFFGKHDKKRFSLLFKEMFVILNDKHLFKRDFLLSNSVLFLEEQYRGEDSLFMAKAIECAGSFFIANEPLQNYKKEEKEFSFKDIINEVKSIGKSFLLSTSRISKRAYSNVLVETLKSHGKALLSLSFSQRNEIVKMIRSYHLKHLAPRNRIYFFLLSINVVIISRRAFKIKP